MTRFGRLDALRGMAMAWMAAYHFAFDLNFFRLAWLRLSSDPVWTVQRTCIVALFVVRHGRRRLGAAPPAGLAAGPAAGAAGR